MINRQLQSLAVDMSTLELDPQNARDHSVATGIHAIMASLSNFGQQKPIVVDPNGQVVAGNGTYMAAKELGWTQIAAVVYDGDGASDGFAIADNRTAELSRWGYEILAGKLIDLREGGFDIETLGWKDYELVPILEARWEPDAPTDEEFTIPEDKGAPIKLTKDQREIVDKLIRNVRKEYEDDYSEGRCIELVCADYLAGK